ncbi:MAG: CdvA-like protein [Candidatus Bathyarchaeia archaeon]
MFSWKRSFEKINSEYETVLKKRQALNNLYSSGKISQSTFELFNKEMGEALAEIEKQKNMLLEKMAAKVKEGEEQIKVLERLLANYEIQHVGGEISEEDYQREITLLSLGLENARKELDAIKETMNKLTSVPKNVESVAGQPIIKPEAVAETSVGKVEVETVDVKAEVETQTSTENVPETQTIEAKTEGENVEK